MWTRKRRRVLSMLNHLLGREYPATHDAAGDLRHRRVMDRDAAVTQLPLMYQRVVALLDEGRTSGEIAACLGIDPIAIPALIELAMAKLERARDDAPGPTSGSCNVPD